jgi:hypothetical protein
MYFWLPVRCAECDWEGMVVGQDPPSKRPMWSCGQCGRHHLLDRDPDPDDEGVYMSGRTAADLVGMSVAARRKDRLNRRGGRFKVHPGFSVAG